jgi:hypothetical protein
MAFRTDGLSKAYAKAQTEAIRIRSYASNAQNTLANNTVSANLVIGIMFEMKSAIEVWDAVAALSGIAQYARDQEDDQAYNVVAEFNAMRTEAVGVRDWIITNFPDSGDPDNYLLREQINPDGSIVTRQFTSAQTSGLQTALGQLVATIEGT